MTTFDDLGRPMRWGLLERIYAHAEKSYRLQHLDCRGALFRTSLDRTPERAFDYSLGWDGLFGGGLEVTELAGDHIAIMRQPHVTILAHEVSKFLDRHFA